MTIGRELRRRDEAKAWLAAGLCLARLVKPSAEEYALAAPWLLGALSEAGALPPPGFIADIGHLLTGRSLRQVAPLPAVGSELRDAVSGYEDHVLGRLEADPRIDAAIDAVARLTAADHRDAAVAVFCVHLLSRLDYSATVAIGPGVARHVLHLPVEDIVAAGHAAITETGDVYTLLLDGYRGLIAGARRLGTLISEPEIFLLEHFAALGELTQRLAIEQMIAASDALGAQLPRRLKPRGRIDRGRIPTALAADDHYPTGGFSSLSTSGSMENLVVSELIYMEEERGADVDLFDLRYAEGELLYYTRDESVFVRNQREITFALMPDLAGVRYKDAELRWQRLVIALGLVSCTVRRLAEWLEGEGLVFRAVFVAGPGGSDPLSGERALCEILLAEWIAREMARVTTEASAEEVLRQAVRTGQRVEATLIFVSAQPMNLIDLADLAHEGQQTGLGPLVGSICLGAPSPVLTWSHRPASRAGPAERRIDLWQEWVSLTLSLLQEVL